MTSVVVILSIALLVSISLNIFMFWYGRAILEDFYYMSDNLGSLIEQIILFSEHLRSVHELEMFYGDEILGGLIRHSKDLVETVQDFVEIVELFEADEETDVNE
ncbi:MAG: hypothetical protein CML17_08860 [Pusillimonas sp.]|jgi:hypothetical protein|nr:hypothetical protein [Pusillimonas sp.]